MISNIAKHSAAIGLLFAAIGAASAPLAEPQHGIAMYGDPALPPDFVSLPYADPNAPKGGRIVFGEQGGFDSLNPHILKGRAPYALRGLIFESLMGRNWDEPFTLYGLLAETVETGPNREWVEFTLRPEAKFSDGSPVTVEDVIWSYETLGTDGHPRFHGSWAKVEKIEQTGPQSVRITFNTEDRELALVMGLRPIFQKSQFEGRDFAESSMVPPVTTGPYVISEAIPGRHVTLTRNPDYWGEDLGFNSGRNNFDEVRLEYFADGSVIFEAFKAGEISSFREGNPARWEDSYNFPAIQSGDVLRAEIDHERPTGIYGLVMNTRLPVFQDWRVREALLYAFNFEFISQAITGGRDPRIASYFSNSVLGMEEGPAEGKTRALLEPFADQLLPGALEGYTLPVGDGTERNRRNIRTALSLLEEAGWTPVDGVMQNAQGDPLSFEILLRQGGAEQQAIINMYVQSLERLGIRPKITTVDNAQYTERTNAYDFGMTFYVRALSLSPGNEQMLYWGSTGVTQPGSRNWMGMDSPAAEAMITAMLNAESQEDFVAATKALDRVLTTGRYVIPLWYSDVSRIAYDKSLHFPEDLPIYGDWIGWQPDVWWYEEG